MLGWFRRLPKAGKIAVVGVVLAATGAAGVTAVSLSSNARLTSPVPPIAQPSAGVPDIPIKTNCPADLTYTTRSPGGGNIDSLETALFFRTDCGRATKQVGAKRPADVRLSPDGRFVAFTDLEPGADPGAEVTDYRDAPARELYVADRAGKVRQITRLGNHGQVSQAVWSPDGKTLAFLYKQADGTGQALQVVAIESGEVKQILADGDYRGLAWNGTKLFTLEQRAKRTVILSVAAVSGQQAVVADLGVVYAQTLMVSPDGRYILYDLANEIPHTVWSFDTQIKSNSKIATLPRNNAGLSLTSDWRLLYAAYTPENTGESFPANEQERIGIHAVDLNTNADTIILPDQNIDSVDVVRDGVVGPTPIALLPNYEFVSLGDSFSSGEGAPVKSADGKVRYIVGTDTDTNRCHRSMGAYPVLTHEAVGKGTGFIFKACSGALIEDFWKPYSQNHNGANAGEPAQLDWLNARTKVVTLTIGGNNASFGEVMEYCATRVNFVATCEAVWKGPVESAINNLSIRGKQHDDFASLYGEIKRLAPNARIYVIGYPRFFPQSPPLFCVTGVTAPTAPQPSFILSDMEWINHEITSLNEVIRKAAEAANVSYIDPTDTLQGHELCSSSPWINNAKGEVVGKHRIESYHPNANGHIAIAEAVKGAVS